MHSGASREEEDAAEEPAAQHQQVAAGPDGPTSDAARALAQTDLRHIINALHERKRSRQPEKGDPFGYGWAGRGT